MVDLVEIRDDVLREMYDEAEPGLDFDDLLDDPDEYPDDWYEQHTLDSERQREILDKHLEQYDLTEQEHTSLVMTCILDLGPATQ